MRYFVLLGDQQLEVELEAGENGCFTCSIKGESWRGDLRPIGREPFFSLIIEGVPFEVAVLEAQGLCRVQLQDQQLSLRVESEQERHAHLLNEGRQDARAHIVRSEMPGIVRRLLVHEMEDVEAGTPLLILEAMKMENEVRAAHKGRVEVLLVSEGETVEAGQELVRIG